MNPSSKRHLLTLGSLICLAIVLVGLTEFWTYGGEINRGKPYLNAFHAMLICTAFAFPLLGIALYLLKKQEDITTAKQTQADLIKAKEGAEAASRAKDEFLSVMGHEMRTPLNPILGFSEILRQNITTKPESDYIKTIITAANRQLRLIEDILEYLRINRGEIKPSARVPRIKSSLSDRIFQLRKENPHEKDKTNLRADHPHSSRQRRSECR